MSAKPGHTSERSVWHPTPTRRVVVETLSDGEINAYETGLSGPKALAEAVADWTRRAELGIGMAGEGVVVTVQEDGHDDLVQRLEPMPRNEAWR